MKKTYQLLSAAVLGLALLSPVQAIVVSSTFWGAKDAGEAATFAQEAGRDFSNVVRLRIGDTGICSGSLISAHTILTAKHCTSGVLAGAILVDFDKNGNGSLGEIDDQTNKVSWIFEVPDTATPGLTDGTDLALLTLDGVAPSWVTSYQRLWDGNVLGSFVAMVGYGGQGVDSLVDPTAGKSRWAAQNVVDEVGQAFDPRPPAGYRPNSANIISTDFDKLDGSTNTLAFSSSVPVELEGTTAGGDSGGPLLAFIDDEWLIAGVLSGGASPDANGPITFGDVSWWTGVSVFRSEITKQGGVFFSHIIDNTVPEPGSLALALGSLFAAGSFGKRRRTH